MIRIKFKEISFKDIVAYLKNSHRGNKKNTAFLIILDQSTILN